MKEIELKILEIDKHMFVKKLLELGAQKIYDGKIKDMQFDFPEKSIVGKKDLFRLRRYQDKNILTYKDAKVDDNQFLIFDETEVCVKDAGLMEEIIYSLGLSCTKFREKIRTSYTLGKLQFDIDQFPRIPCYVEIEGPKEDIKKIITKLGFSMEDTTNMTASKVLEKYGELRHTIKFE